MTVPGIGLLTAMAFHLEIYKPKRFQREEEIVSYLGLAPTVKHSREKHPRGHLVPVGQKRLRSLLVEASWIWVTHDKYAASLYHKLLGRTGVPQKAIARGRMLLNFFKPLFILFMVLFLSLIKEKNKMTII